MIIPSHHGSMIDFFMPTRGGCALLHAKPRLTEPRLRRALALAAAAHH